MLTGYLDSARKQFAYYKSLGEKTINQLPDEALFWQYNSESNSIATIVKHVSGNMVSRWTDFMRTDGEKPDRDREAEFDNDLLTRNAVLTHWEMGWDCLFNALDSITDADLNRVIFIRNEAHTVLEAVNRQLAHYPHHVGQLVYIGKMIRGADWQQLSIARGGSAQFNAEKFGKSW